MLPEDGQDFFGIMKEQFRQHRTILARLASEWREWFSFGKPPGDQGPPRTDHRVVQEGVVSECPRFGLTDSERAVLLRLARQALTCTANRMAAPQAGDAGDLPGALMEKRACFVTLKQNGALRGCVGNLVADCALCQAVQRNSVKAASADPRFARVCPEEVDRIRIEISLLTEPKPLRFESPEDLMGKLRPKTDGVVFRLGRQTATFLPQVWGQLPVPADFLSQLSLKAGCGAEGWRDAGAELAVYQVEHFTESSQA